MATQDFYYANKLGEGGFGSVYKVNAYFISYHTLFKLQHSILTSPICVLINRELLKMGLPLQ